tara:strand:+ start:749 stop:1087 length:339 start_codon:yes stop_codon:yes gene_type:complete
MAGLIHYKFDERTIEWMMLRSGEVDLPRDPDNWYNLAYRSIRYDNRTATWQYYKRKVGRSSVWSSTGQDFEILYESMNLRKVVNYSNQIHGIEDQVSPEYKPEKSPYEVLLS